MFLRPSGSLLIKKISAGIKLVTGSKLADLNIMVVIRYMQDHHKYINICRL